MGHSSKPLELWPGARCSIAHEIMGQPGWEIAPAFGAGCCSSLNSDRLAIIRDNVARGREPYARETI